MTLQIQQVLTERGTLGYVNGRLELAGERIASADMTIGGGKGSTFRVTPAGQGRNLFFYVADFGHDAEGRRAGSTGWSAATCTSRATSTTLRPIRRSTARSRWGPTACRR